MSTLTGLGRMTRLVLRRDRVRLPVWIVGSSAFLVISALSLPPLYKDQASIDQYAALTRGNPALIAMAGPGYGMDDPNIGQILVNEVQLWGCILLALMSMFLVNRHTRAEEDVERADVLRSSVVGRHAPTAAALIAVTAAEAVVAVISAVGFVASGYAVTGSIALAASFLGLGIVFVGVAAVAAQISGTGRGALGLAGIVLGASFVLRALGDIGENALRWLSPLGWAQAVRAFAGEAFWTLGLCVGFGFGLVIAAFWLSTQRNLGSGLLPGRLGRSAAPRWMRSPVGLAFRLHRASIASWSIGIALFGAIYGSIANDIEEMIADNEIYADFLAQLQGASLVDSFLATSINLLALLATAYAISAALRIRTEEGSGRAEPILAGPIDRARWAMSHLIVAVVGTVLVMASAGFGLGLAYAFVSGDSSQVLRMVGAALVTVPAVLVIAGGTVALFGLLPRMALAAWGFLAVAVLVGIFGQLLRLPQWSRDLSPLSYVPGLPAEQMRILPLVMLTALAVALTAAGLVGLRVRDVRA